MDKLHFVNMNLEKLFCRCEFRKTITKYIILREIEERRGLN